MPRKSTIQNERYCRSRAYRVYSTYSLRGYHKKTTRIVYRVFPSRDTLGEERERLQIFKSSVAWSTHSHLILMVENENHLRGEVRERGGVTGEMGSRSTR
jgi:hypothetical protein